MNMMNDYAPYMEREKITRKFQNPALPKKAYTVIRSMIPVFDALDKKGMSYSDYAREAGVKYGAVSMRMKTGVSKELRADMVSFIENWSAPTIITPPDPVEVDAPAPPIIDINDPTRAEKLGANGLLLGCIPCKFGGEITIPDPPTPGEQWDEIIEWLMSDVDPEKVGALVYHQIAKQLIKEIR